MTIEFGKCSCDVARTTEVRENLDIQEVLQLLEIYPFYNTIKPHYPIPPEA